MKQKYYTIYDKTAKEFHELFPAVNDGVAARTFKNIVAGAPVILRDDLQLWCVGHFDTETAHFVEVPVGPYQVTVINDDNSDNIGKDGLLKEEVA